MTFSGVVMNRLAIVSVALLFSSPVLSQRMAENAKSSSEQLLQKIGPDRLTRIQSNSEIITKQSELEWLSQGFNLPRAPSLPIDDSSPIVFYGRLKPKGTETVDRVVKVDVTENLTNKTAQERISTEFCLAEQGKDCKEGLGKFSAALTASPRRRSDACIAAQKKVYELSGFNEGVSNGISIDKLKEVADYHSACTTEKIPQHMRSLLGIIIDTSEPLNKNDTGIYLPNLGKFAPIGMAVQVSPNRIYTARHVLFHDVDNTFRDKRNLGKLLFLPITAPDKLIPLSQEIRPASISGEPTSPFSDQAVVEMAAAYTPASVKWPVVTRSEINASDEATPLFIAGFQMALARAATIGMMPEQTNIQVSDWPKYVRRDDADSCRRVTQNATGCMLHACDTVGGLSGSPIFAQLAGAVADQATVIGVHRGGAFNKSSMLCSAGVDGRDLNIGVVPNIALIKN
jgi:hypothetical protein